MNMQNNILYFILLALALAGCGHAAGDEGAGKESPVPVKVVTIERQLIREPVFASGTFTTDDETIRSFKTGGVVQRLFVREGDAIKEGQLLATLDLTEITAQVSQATLACAKAQRDYKRVANLYHDSVVTLEQFQNAGTGLDMAREQLTAARFNQAFSEIRATGDGFILRKFVNEGQVVGAGAPVFQTNGAGKGNWILRVAVGDGQWSSLDIGDSAVISSDLPGLKTARGTVLHKSEGVDPLSGTFTIDIRPVVNPGRLVASGMFGKAAITPARGRQCWKIPYDALLDGNGCQGFVFVTCDGKKATRVRVSIAGITRDNVLIDSGLEECSTLIVSGSAYLTDQSPVTIIH